MANGHGGPRAGAGRKSKAEKYASQIDTTERAIVARLPELLEHQFDLATGGAKRTEKRYELALSITVEDTETNPSGTIVKVKRQLFPNAGPDEMKLVEKKVITPEPDRAAIEYLIDRILGKPTASMELTGADGGPLEIRPNLDDLTVEELEALHSLMKKATPTLADNDAPNGSGN